MTDNEIIKNLDKTEYRFINETDVLVQDVIDLINRQKVEIKRLKNKCDDCAGCSQWKCDCSNIRVETIKEFAERLKGLSRFSNSDRF